LQFIKTQFSLLNESLLGKNYEKYATIANSIQTSKIENGLKLFSLFKYSYMS